MDSLDCYRTFLALKQHFSQPEYDFFRYNGKTTATAASLGRRKDRYWFEKLAKMRDQKNRMLAHFCETTTPYIRDVVLDNDLYLARQKRIESLPYDFKKELKILLPDFDANFRVEDNNHPYLLKEYMGRRLSLESLSIIADLTECLPYWKKRLGDDHICSSVIMKIEKYLPFLNFDKGEFRDILVDFHIGDSD
jgi:hypothetical protein